MRRGRLAAVAVAVAFVPAAWLGAAALRVGVIMHDVDVLSRSETNRRGDTATAEVHAGGATDRQMQIEIFLRRAWRPWRITLMTGRADAPSIDLGWQDDDDLEVTLGLGPDGAVETSTQQVGAIHVRYVLEPPDIGMDGGGAPR